MSNHSAIQYAFDMLDSGIPVLGAGFVKFLDLMPHPATGVSADTAVASAARTSFLGDSKGEAQDGKLIRYLMANGHTSPFEQVEFKFLVRAPLMVFWQWVRHRTFHFQSVNSQSGRYTEFDEESFYAPFEWRKQSASNKQGSDGSVDEKIGRSLADQLSEHFDQCFDLYRHALEQGVAKEQARLFLPGFAMFYTWVVKVDLWNLMQFLKLRLADDAQWEIRQYAEAIKAFVAPVAPVSWEAYSGYVLNK